MHEISSKRSKLFTVDAKLLDYLVDFAILQMQLSQGQCSNKSVSHHYLHSANRIASLEIALRSNC
jgi:hypothetical protein